MKDKKVVWRNLPKLPCEVFMEMARQEVNQRRQLEVILKERIGELDAENAKLLTQLNQSRLLCNEYKASVAETPMYKQLVAERNKLSERIKRLQDSLNDLIFKYNQATSGRN